MEPDISFKRIHLFEFEDFSWFPGIIRTGGTDYLRYFLILQALAPVPALYYLFRDKKT